MSQERWYLLVGDDRIGPLTTSELKEKAGAGALDPRDLVWKYGLSDWTPAEEFEYLFPAETEAFQPPPAQRTEPAREPETPRAEEPAATAPAVERQFAHPGLRVAAAAIDIAILSLPFSFVLFGATVIPDVFEDHQSLIQLILTVLFWTYFAAQECAPRQGTIGKRILGLKVTDLSGQPISFARASARHFARVFLVIGFLLALFSERRQALYDVVTGCVVLQEPDSS